MSAQKPARCAPAILSDGAKPDPQKLWIPEHLAPLYGTPSYDLLDAAQRLRYNHYCALHMAEQFIWIEASFIIAPILRLIEHDGVSERYRPILQSLVADEKCHHAVFWQLLAMARPDLYDGREGYRLFSVPPGVAWTARLIRWFPRVLSSWVLAANFFEERSVLVYREYEAAGDKVDSVFARVHALHAQDEARHCHLDRRLAEWLVDGQGRTASFLNGRLLALAITTYHDPRWGNDSAARALVRDCPALGAHLPMFLHDIARARDACYQRGLFDREATPLTDRNRARYPILDAAIRRLG